MTYFPIQWIHGHTDVLLLLLLFYFIFFCGGGGLITYACTLCTFYLPNIISKFCMVMIFVIVGLQTLFYTYYVGIFMMSLYEISPNLITSLITTIKINNWRQILYSCHVNLHFIKSYLKRVVCFSKVSCLASFQHPKLSDAAILQVCMLAWMPAGGGRCSQAYAPLPSNSRKDQNKNKKKEM
jgi:hypothetical protein